LVPNDDDYLVFADRYIVKNNSLNFDKFVVWESWVYDKKDSVICSSISISDLRIYDINGTLYGQVDHKLYQIEEEQYFVLFKYDNPQHGLIYWSSVIVLLGYLLANEMVDLEELYKKGITYITNKKEKDTL
jgi:hypothetical protein